MKADAYMEILRVLKKHEALLEEDYAINIISRVSDRIEVLKVSDKFMIPVKIGMRPSWIELNIYLAIGLFGEKYSRTIAWSDDGRQPVDEHLLRISFPTGPFIFHRGERCDETFKAFFNELKSYEPKYSDSANNSLYFSSGNAQKVYFAFDGILKKHRATVTDELNRKKVIELKKQLQKLEDGPTGE